MPPSAETERPRRAPRRGPAALTAKRSCGLAAVRLVRGEKIRIGALMINSGSLLGDLVAVDRAVLVIREQRQVECDLGRIADLDLMSS
jgi:hypothetical protein